MTHEPIIASFPQQCYTKYSKTENFYIVAISNIQRLISQISRAIGPLRERSDFFSQLGFDI